MTCAHFNEVVHNYPIKKTTWIVITCDLDWFMRVAQCVLVVTLLAGNQQFGQQSRHL